MHTFIASHLLSVATVIAVDLSAGKTVIKICTIEGCQRKIIKTINNKGFAFNAICKGFNTIQILKFYTDLLEIV